MAARDPRNDGFVLVAVLFVLLILVGLAVGLLQESVGARTSIRHHESSFRALEILEVGFGRAETEVRSQQNLATAGIGNVSGDFGSGDFDVVAAQDAVLPDRWTLRGESRHGLSVRRAEVGLRRRENRLWVDALFSMGDLPLSNTTTDSFDSTLGSYASQAVNADTHGTYADLGGSVGSNGDIVADGSSVAIRGNAIPGPFGEVSESGSPTITGDTVPREVEIDLPPASYEEFLQASQVNANDALKGGKGPSAGRYDDRRKTYEVNGNSIVTLPAGTYFFSEFTVRAGSTIRVDGPVRIYVTGTFGLHSGSTIAAPQASDFQLFAHPYPLPSGFYPSETEVVFQGGSTATMAVYAPGADVSFGGGNHLYGAVVGGSIELTGNNAFSYDRALGNIAQMGVATLERLYWRDLAPPRR